MSGNPDSPYWWLRPIELEELKGLRECVKEAHAKGQGFASVTMNRIKIALEELQERMEKEAKSE